MLCADAVRHLPELNDSASVSAHWTTDGSAEPVFDGVLKSAGVRLAEKE